MARDNESTMQWKLDIANLKKGMQDARQQISLANAEFKNATAGMGRWSDSATGVEAKTKQLTKVLDGQTTILDELRQQYAIVSKEMGDTSPEAQKLKIQIENQEAAVKKTESQLQGYNERLAEMQAEEAESSSEFSKLTKSIDEQEKQLADLKDEYAKATINFGENSDEAQSLAGQITDLSGELRDNRQRLADASGAADSLDQSLQDTKQDTEKAGDGFTVLKGTLADLVSAGIQKAIDGFKDLGKYAYEAWQGYDEGADTIIAATGATGDAAEDLLNVYKGVTGNIVADYADIGTAVGEVNTRFGSTGDELQALSEDFIKFSQLNGVDLKKSIDSTQSAMAAWNIETKDAGAMLDLLNKAGQDTGVSVDTLAQSMVTNAPALQEMGYNASDAAMFLANLEKNGVDVSATMGGMKKALQNASAEGKPMAQAMQEMEDSIKNASSSTDAITTATELFGAKAGASIATAVRNGNLSFAELGTAMADFEGNVNQTFEDTLDAPDKFNLAIQGIKTELADMAGQLMEDFGPQIDAAFAWVKDTALPAIKDGISWAMDNLPTIGAAIAGIATGLMAFNVVGMIQGLVGKFKEWKLATDGMTLSQKLLNLAMAANPIGIVVALIAGLVAAIAVLWTTNEDFRNKVIEIWGNVKEFVGNAIDAIGKFFTETLPATIKAMLAWFKQLPGKIGGFLSQAWAKVSTWASNMWGKAKETGSKFLSNVIEFFSQLPGKAWELLKNVVSKVAEWGGNLASKGKEAAKRLFDSVWNGIKSLPDKMLSIGSDLVKGLWNGINNMTDWVIGKIKGFGDSVLGGIKSFFGIESPSKVMRDEVGKMLAEGIAEGFGDEMPDTLRTMQKSMGGTVDALKGSVSLAATGVTASNGGTFAGASGTGAGSGEKAQTVIFNQYNNSPKALDRLSIYRDTNSLLFSAKVGLKHV